MVYVRAFSSRTRQAPDDYDPSTDSVSKAQFILGEDGKVEGLGVQLDGEMGEAKIWFVLFAVLILALWLCPKSQDVSQDLSRLLFPQSPCLTC